MNTFTPELFSIDEEQKWKDYLEDKGYVVIKNILSREEKERILSQFKIDLRTVSSGFDWTKSSTWTIENTPLMFGKGMGVFNGFGQSDFMWQLRTNPRIQDIYHTIFGTEELAVSLDGFSFFVSDKQKSNSWLHIDQNPVNKLYSIQGAYNFNEVGENDAGFVVVPRSHKTFTPSVKHKKDWIMVDQELFQPQSVKLLIPDNCFVLWNSKTIHANVGMNKRTKKGTKKETKKETKDINRLTAYITFLPKIHRTEGIRQKRINAYRASETTSHWANKCELKRYPFGFKSRYEARGFGKITASLTESGKIPEDRFELL